MKKKITIIAITTTSASAIALSCAAIFGFNKINPTIAEDQTHTISYNATSATAVSSLTVGDNTYEYSYTESTNGTKYGAIVDKYTADHEDGDFLSMKGTSNFIYFSYGNINSNGTYEQAKFNGKVKSVSMTVKYVSSNDYTLYSRVYYSNDGTFTESKRKGYTVTKEYTTISFDLTSVEANYIKIGVSNGFSVYHISNITIEYGC